MSLATSNGAPATDRIERFLFLGTPMLQCHSRERVHYLGIKHQAFTRARQWSRHRQDRDSGLRQRFINGIEMGSEKFEASGDLLNFNSPQASTTKYVRSVTSSQIKELITVRFNIQPLV